MNMLKILRYLLIDQFLFLADGADGGGGGADGGGGGAAGGGQPQNYFGSVPETWRQDLVSYAGYEGDDAGAFGNVLERIPDLKSFVNNYREMQVKARNGELSNGLPKDPTAEQLSAWREANGVPLDAAGYGLKDMGLGDNDAEIFEAMVGVAHNGNVPAGVMQEMVNTFKGAKEALMERQIAQDGVDSQQGAAVLKDSWGADYQRNLNMVDGLLNTMPESVRDAFKEGRLSTGVGLLNSPEVMQFMAHVARKLNPAGALVPGTPNPGQTVAEEIKKIEAVQRNDPDAYWKDKGMQARLRELYDADEQLRAAS